MTYPAKIRYISSVAKVAFAAPICPCVGMYTRFKMMFANVVVAAILRFQCSLSVALSDMDIRYLTYMTKATIESIFNAGTASIKFSPNTKNIICSAKESVARDNAIPKSASIFSIVLKFCLNSNLFSL